MSASSKVFLGSDLTPSGDAAVVGDALVVSAVADYDLDAAALGALTDGDNIPNWTVAQGSGSAKSFRKQTNGGDPVARISTDGWAGAYGATDFGDGCFMAVAKAVAGRFTPIARFSPSAARGYPVQCVSPSSLTLWTSTPSNFLGANAPARVTGDMTHPALPWTGKLQTLTRAAGNVEARFSINGVERFTYLDGVSKWPTGRIAIQAFVSSTDYTRLAFFPVRTGGFTATFTPFSVTGVKRILVQWDDKHAILKRPSEVFEYRLDGGSWTALPDDGEIDAACTATIELRANSTLKNDYDSSEAVSVYGVAVEIDGIWDAATPPGSPSGLTLTAVGARAATLDWTDGANTEVLQAYLGTSSDFGTAVLAGAAAAGAETFIFTGLTPATQYWAWLIPFNANGAGSTGGPATATMPTAITTVPTGKRNAIASFRKWLSEQAPTAGPSDFVYEFLSDVSNPETFTRVGVSELQYFQPGNSAFGMNIFPASTYPVATPAKHGTLNSMLLQIEIKADASVNNDAVQRVYKIRDRIRAVIVQAGVANDETDVVAVAPCEVLDFEGAEAPTGVFIRCPLEQENAIQEIYIPPDANAPSIHTLRLLVRLEWYELN